MEATANARSLRGIDAHDYSDLKKSLRIIPDTFEPCKWPCKNGGVLSYQRSFREVMWGKSMVSIMAEAKQFTGRAAVLDLMGYGVFIRQLSQSTDVDRGLSVALGDPRDVFTWRKDNEMGLSLLEGNILARSTWNGIGNWLVRQNDGVGFNLIIARPIGGLSTLPKSKQIHYLLLQRAWKLLADGGLLLTQVPSYYGDYGLAPILDQWVSTLNRTAGLSADYALNGHYSPYAVTSTSALKILRLEGAPQTLPVCEDIPE